jgi:hypothetical protein
MLTAMLAGCGHKDPYVDQNTELVDQATVDAIRTQPIDQAIIVQHTLYPYQFVEGKDGLNDLGQHDLRVIADHFREHGGPLNVQRGSESQELYNARVCYVAKFIADCGVSDKRIRIAEGMPGGAGLPSYWVVKILAKQKPGQGSGEIQQPTGMAVDLHGGASQ